MVKIGRSRERVRRAVSPGGTMSKSWPSDRINNAAGSAEPPCGAMRRWSCRNAWFCRLPAAIINDSGVAWRAVSEKVTKRCLPPASCSTPASSRSARTASMRLDPVRCGSAMLADSSMAKITDFSRAGTGTFSSRDGWSNRRTMIAKRQPTAVVSRNRIAPRPRWRADPD